MYKFRTWVLAVGVASLMSTGIAAAEVVDPNYGPDVFVCEPIPCCVTQPEDERCPIPGWVYPDSTTTTTTQPEEVTGPPMPVAVPAPVVVAVPRFTG
jgi:hypothetical protein